MSGMDLRTVARRSVCDEVYDQLAGNIVRGEVAAGDSLLSERRLAEVLGVSRPIVREALQRLAIAGLVEVRQGGSTTVRDYRRHAGLPVLAQLLLPAGSLDLGVARSLLEARLHIGPEVASLAASRAGAALEGPLTEVLSQWDGAADPVRQQWHALEFWDLLVDGCGSIVYRLMYNSMRAAYEPLLAALAPTMQGETVSARPLAAAVVAGDATAARSAAHDLLAPTTHVLLEAISALEG